MNGQCKSISTLSNRLSLALVLVLGFAYYPTAQANSTPIQLAYYSGGHHGGGHHGGSYRHGGGGWGIFFGPGYTGYNHSRAYWTGWRSYYRPGYHCQRSCLVNRYNGAIVRCKTRCF